VYVRHHHFAALRWSHPDTFGHVNRARALSLVEDDERAFWMAYQEDAS
jgi:acyl-CoA thioesterase FadM